MIAHNDMWLVYDGECPLCQMGASLYRLKQSVNQLHVIDAREQNSLPILQEINAAGLDLDEGMVIKYQGRLYHGKHATQLMATLGSEKGLFNMTNNFLFRSAERTNITYPLMKMVRNLALKIKGVGKIRNLHTD